jgi:hypothetical protein
VNDPEKDFCSDHQYSEAELKPVLDEAVSLLDAFMVTLSNTYEKRAKKVIDKRDEIFS